MSLEEAEAHSRKKYKQADRWIMQRRNVAEDAEAEGRSATLGVSVRDAEENEVGVMDDSDDEAGAGRGGASWRRRGKQPNKKSGGIAGLAGEDAEGDEEDIDLDDAGEFDDDDIEEAIVNFDFEAGGNEGDEADGGGIGANDGEDDDDTKGLSKAGAAVYKMLHKGERGYDDDDMSSSSSDDDFDEDKVDKDPRLGGSLVKTEPGAEEGAAGARGKKRTATDAALGAGSSKADVVKALTKKPKRASAGQRDLTNRLIWRAFNDGPLSMPQLMSKLAGRLTKQSNKDLLKRYLKSHVKIVVVKGDKLMTLKPNAPQD